ncbi:MAG: 30S ribosomal protein S21 [Chloroflexi bacterium]|nr:30S ribosomal protein S21 [Chloroflexota bacterium]
MPEVRLGEGESFESLLRRFTRKVQQEGIISEVRRRGFFEKPSIKRSASAKRQLNAAKATNQHNNVTSRETRYRP